MAKAAVVRKQPNAVSRYFRETAAELRKVSWPTRQEAIQLTLIVVVVVAVTSAFLGLLDYVFSKAIGALIGL